MSGRALETLFDRLHDYSVFIIELMGTFFLILTIGLVSNAKPSPPVIGPIAIGSTLMVCVFMGGHISGAHYNPAVTFGVWLSGRDKIKLRTAIGYVFAQLIGSLLASFSYWTITDDTMPLYPTSGTSDSKAMFVEILYTTLLVSVVLNTATTKSQADNSFYGLAIGFTVVAGATCTGPISGGVFNPAVGFGPIIVNSLNNGAEKLSHLWIYWIGPPLGAVLAAFIFRITNHHHEYRSSQSELAALPRDPDMPRDSDTLLDNPAAAPATYTI